MTVEQDLQNLNEALSQSAGFLLSQASRLLRERVETALVPLRLSLYEYVILRLISLEAPMSQGDLGETYGIDPTTMVGLVDGLEGRDLVQRQKDPADRRRYKLRLTPKGRKTLSRAKRIVNDSQSRFLEPLAPPEWEQVRACLWKLISHAQSKHIGTGEKT